MGRTKLKCKSCDHLTLSKLMIPDFSPTPAHSSDNQKASGGRFLGWIMPTVRTSEFTVLQTVGLDAAVVSCPGRGHERGRQLTWTAT
jgi:hypothetical protein